MKIIQSHSNLLSIAMMNSISASPNAQQEDVVIAVMGSTGSGKSSFIKLLTGDKNIVIGHNIDSETIEVLPYILYDNTNNRKVVLVDTPGFDDSRPDITDTEILRKIADFLVNEYNNDRKLNGLVYFQRISDPRFGGQSRRNLRMFKSLCGTDAYENVVVVTTFWDKVTEDEGSRREAQLSSSVFKDIMVGGGRLVRHDQNQGNALQVIGLIYTFTPKNIQIVEEIGRGIELEDTAAGSVRSKELDDLIAKHKKEVAGIMDEMAAIRNSNEALQRELKEERENLRQELERWESEKVELKNGLEEEKAFRVRLEAEAAKEREAHKIWQQAQEQRLKDQEKAHEERTKAMLLQNSEAATRAERTRSDAQLAEEREAHKRWQAAQDKEWNDKQKSHDKKMQDMKSQIARTPNVSRPSPKTNYIEAGIKLGKEIPFVPNFISVPLMGSAGLGMEIFKGIRSFFG